MATQGNSGQSQRDDETIAIRRKTHKANQHFPSTIGPTKPIQKQRYKQKLDKRTNAIKAFGPRHVRPQHS